MDVLEQPFFNKLWDLTVQVCCDAQVPIYRKRNDPKIFTTVQKLFLWFYKVKKGLTLRDLIDDLSTSTLVDYLRLPRIPNYSMLSHFLESLPMKLLKIVEHAIQKILPTFEEIIVDSTGFECTHPSHYFCQRIDSKYPSDGFLTLYAVIDQEHGYVRTQSTRTRKTHDAKMFKPLVKKIKTPIKICRADRAHDSETNHEYLVEERDCIPLILQKNMLKPLDKCTGKHRREMREIFDYGNYLKRNKIEAIFSSIKRKFGCALTTRTLRNQHKELLLKIIVYNLERKIRTTILIFILRRKSFQQDHNHVIPLFNRTFGTQIKGRFFPSKRTYGFWTSDLNIIKTLHEFGFPYGNKSQIVSIPAKIVKSYDNDFNRAFLRGYFDTDGSVNFDKKNNHIYHNYPRICLSTVSAILSDQIRDILTMDGFKFHQYIIRSKISSENTKYTTHLYGIDQVTRLIEAIHPANGSKMSRFWIWKRFGFCPPYSSFKERMGILNNILEPRTFYWNL